MAFAAWVDAHATALRAAEDSIGLVETTVAQAALTAQVAHLRDQSDGYRQRCTAAESKAESLCQQVASLEAELDHMKATMTKITAREEQLVSRVDAGTARLSADLAAAEQAVVAVSTLRGRVAELEQQLAAAQSGLLREQAQASGANRAERSRPGNYPALRARNTPEHNRTHQRHARAQQEHE